MVLAPGDRHVVIGYEVLFIEMKYFFNDRVYFLHN